MSEKAKVITLEQAEVLQGGTIQMQLDSGRQILVHSHGKEEILEIVEPEGEVVMKVRLTGDGPVITVHGASLELKSSEILTLEAKKVIIKAKEEVVVESKGSLEIDSSKKMGLRSDEEIRIVGKMIHLN